MDCRWGLSTRGRVTWLLGAPWHPAVLCRGAHRTNATGGAVTGTGAGRGDRPPGSEDAGQNPSAGDSM